ncbi:MAG TPA: TonB C-terminal domain-containing protein [Granulicella sp.]
MPAPSLETPPNPAEPPQPARIRSTRFGELDEHELVRLLDSLDDERSRARFRESIYIAIFIWMIFAVLLVFGPRVFPTPPQVVNPYDIQKEHQLAQMETPKDIVRKFKTPPAPAPKAPEAQPKNTPTAPAAPAPKPAPQQARPQPQAPAPPPQTAKAQPNPMLPQPQPTQTAPSAPQPVPEAPKPAPSFSGPRSAGDTIRQAMQGAAHDHGNSSGNYAENVTPSKVGVGTGVDILSDTMGVNFNPYLNKIMRQIYNTWIPLIPEEARPPLNKQGATQIRFTILPNGRIGGMVLEGSTHDDALNRAAWGSITGVGQFPPLPSEFHGPNLELRIHYLVNMKPPE